MTDQHEKVLRELIALAAKSSPMPWAIDPDDRPDMEWNNFIVQAARPHMTVCFMAHSGREDNSELEHAAEFIAKASQAVEALTALLDERENLKELLDYTYHASDCQRMRERAFPERCICGLDDLRRELKGESDGKSTDANA